MDKLKHSKSFAPISLIANKPLKLEPFVTNTSGIADWKYWKHVTTVELWQALLLSLNINPPGHGWLIDNAPGGTGDIPYEYLDSQGLTDEFISRWKLIKNKLEHYRLLALLTPTIELTGFISLSFFAKLAVEFEWENLPLELISLATNKEKNDGLSHNPNKELPDNQQDSYIPHTAVGKLTLKAAESIKLSIGKRATAKEVMSLLQDWADRGYESDTLRCSDRKNRSVKWITSKGEENIYTLDACGKTLEKLGKNRN